MRIKLFAVDFDTFFCHVLRFRIWLKMHKRENHELLSHKILVSKINLLHYKKITYRIQLPAESKLLTMSSGNNDNSDRKTKPKEGF